MDRAIDRARRGIKKRCAIQRAVAREFSCPETLSGAELDWLEQRMKTELSQLVLALQVSVS